MPKKERKIWCRRGFLRKLRSILGIEKLKQVLVPKIGSGCGY